MDAVGMMVRTASLMAWAFVIPVAVIVTVLVIVVIGSICEAISNYRKFNP